MARMKFDNDPKQYIRSLALSKRGELAEKDARSEQILRTLVELPEYQAAETILFYVDARDEVRTKPGIIEGLTDGKRIVVPYCRGDELELFHLQSMGELGVGAFRVLEPKEDLRAMPGKKLPPEQLDLLVVPGVAFDPLGKRLGYGRGYFDRLLCHIRSDSTVIGLSFDCQIFSELPIESHDVPMHKVITETQVYDCKIRIR